MSKIVLGLTGLVLASVTLAGCGGETTTLIEVNGESCMFCHNVSPENDYAGPGIENPHPFPGAENILCTTCHGGHGDGEGKDDSHVPPPPEIGDDQNLINDDEAYFNRLTLTGIDKYDDYTVNGVTYSALDYLQFINPGDLRVVSDGRACGQCHANHVDTVSRSLLATEAGILSGAMFAAGVDNEHGSTLWENTAADKAFREIHDPTYSVGLANTGDVADLHEFPVFSVRGETGGNNIHQNDLYLSAGLDDDIDAATGKVITDSPLANLYHEQVAFTCGDCHLGSAGANNRYGDFRSSGCTSCHMPYALDGRSKSNDPNVNKFEPADPDDIEEPERSHVRSHRIASVAKTLSNGVQVQGIDDYACAGCHQGSNRTVMQYWGIRLDQNQDLRNNFQYPAMPASYQDTTGDPRLFDPDVGNHTFNGRNRRQYILREDYDGDTLDDTPPDIHYEAGMGCIDCHGTFDLHGGDVTSPDGHMSSRMEQAVAVRCETCHGGVDAYAPTVTGTDYDGNTVQLAVDDAGVPLKHVVRESDGHMYLYSRLTGNKHYVPQTHDVVVDNGVENPFDDEPVYTAKGSYAMGKDDGLASTGIGPQQSGAPTGFTHADNLECAACHSSWTNTCMGCHLEGEYRIGNNFSNITGQEIVFEEDNADFVYQSPVFFQLGVDSSNKITQTSANTKTFFSYEDKNNQDSSVFAFSDRNGKGNDPLIDDPALSHNAIMAHSIRGRVDNVGLNEGPRYCVACHLTDEGLANGVEAEYKAFKADLAAGIYTNLDFGELTDKIGLNTGNQKNSPYFVHMVSGLGSGLFLFDEHGCAVNPLDPNNNRAGCDQAPATTFLSEGFTNVAFDLDRIVEPDGTTRASNNHPMLNPGVGPNLRQGADDPNMAGPLGGPILERLTDPDTGIVLDSYLDADSDPVGEATTLVGGGGS